MVGDIFELWLFLVSVAANIVLASSQSVQLVIAFLRSPKTTFGEVVQWKRPKLRRVFKNLLTCLALFWVAPLVAHSSAFGEMPSSFATRMWANWIRPVASGLIIGVGAMVTYTYFFKAPVEPKRQEDEKENENKTSVKAKVSPPPTPSSTSKKNKGKKQKQKAASATPTPTKKEEKKPEPAKEAKQEKTKAQPVKKETKSNVAPPPVPPRPKMAPLQVKEIKESDEELKKKEALEVPSQEDIEPSSASSSSSPSSSSAMLTPSSPNKSPSNKGKGRKKSKDRKKKPPAKRITRPTPPPRPSTKVEKAAEPEVKPVEESSPVPEPKPVVVVSQPERGPKPEREPEHKPEAQVEEEVPAIETEPEKDSSEGNGGEPEPRIDNEGDSVSEHGHEEEVSAGVITSISVESVEGKEVEEEEEEEVKTTELSQEKREKMSRNRERTVGEIFSTEQTYVDSLEILMNEFKTPMRTQVDKKQLKMTDEEFSHVFSNIESIYSLHSMFLVELRTAGVDGDLGSVFVRYADYFRVYSAYISSYNRSLQTVNMLSSRKKFRAFLEEMRAKPAAKNLDLMSYLIMPIQRLPRYEMLLREIDRQSPDDHPHKEAIQKGLAKIRDIAMELNEKKRVAEGMSEVLSIQSKIHGMDWTQFNATTLMIPTRRLYLHDCIEARTTKMEAPSSPISPRGAKKHTRGLSWGFGRSVDKFKKRQIILFNDCCVWLSDSFKFKGCISLAKSRVHVLGEEDESTAFEIHLVGSNFTDHEDLDLCLSFETREKMVEWAAKVREGIAYCKEVKKQKATVSQRMRANKHAHRTNMHSKIASSLLELQSKKNGGGINNGTRSRTLSNYSVDSSSPASSANIPESSTYGSLVEDSSPYGSNTSLDTIDSSAPPRRANHFHAVDNPSTIDEEEA